MLSIKRTILTLALTLTAALASAFDIKIASGERWYGIDQNKTVTIDSKNTIGNPSFLISNKGRYIYSDQPFDATITDKAVTLSREVKVATGGKSLREAYLYCFHRNFREQQPSIEKSLYSSIIYDLRGSKEYLGVNGDLVSCVDKIIAEGWPKGIILLGDDWQTSLGSYAVDEQYYTNLSEQIQKIKEKGFKIIVSITPYVSASGRMFNNYKNQGLLVTDPQSGEPIIIETKGYGYAAIFDITASGAIQIAKNHLAKNKANYGFDGIFTDCGIAADPSINPKHQEFKNLWNALCDNTSMPLNIKSYNAGHYTPSITTYKYQALSNAENFLTDYLSKGFMYMPFNAVAIHCGNGLDNQSQISRYLQSTGLSPMCMVPFLPYAIEDNTIKANAKSIVDMREKLSSYILESLEESLVTGEPLIRSLEYMYPRQGFYDCYDQYMLGTRYLVVPPKGDSNTRTVRFPKGHWYGPNGEHIKGPVVKSITIKDSQMLYFSNQKQ